MYVCNLIAFLCCVMLPVDVVIEARRMRKRRDTCEHGTYDHEGKRCCLCPTGLRLVHHCTDTSGTTCEHCEPKTYLDHPNSETKCQPCKICNLNANMKVKDRCSEYSDTVCECQENYYCDQGDQCRICKPCDTCDEVKTQCTITTNTVCKDTTMSKGAIAAAVLVLLLIIICLVIIYIWKQKKDERSRYSQKVAEEEPLKELDLTPCLSDIADHLGWKVMKRVALHSGMVQASIDNQEHDHPNDAREKTYGLLQDWLQKQGLYEAYPALIKTLQALNERKTADEIKKIVEKGQAKAQP